MTITIDGMKWRGPLPKETIKLSNQEADILVDVRAMLSNYGCIYGKGCQGTVPKNGEGRGKRLFEDRSTMGCCRTAPLFGVTPEEVDSNPDYDHQDRIAPAVDALEPQDCENIDRIKEIGWWKQRGNKEGATAKVATLGGNCIFLNSGDHEKPGCSLWHLAERTGLQPQDVRPMTCHTDPIVALECGREDTAEGQGRPRYLITLRPHWDGWFNEDEWYCTKSPEAYQESTPVYQRMSQQIGWILSKATSDEDLVKQLIQKMDMIWEERKDRVKSEQWNQPVFLPKPVVRKRSEEDE